MFSFHRSRAIGAFLLPPALLLTACGGAGAGSPGPEGELAGRTGEEIIRLGLDSFDGIDTVRMKGFLIEDGDRLDLDVTSSDTGICGGSIVRARQDIEFIAVDEAIYLKGNNRFWIENAGDDANELMDRIGDRWFKTEATDNFDELCDPEKLVRVEMEDLEQSKLSVGGTSDFEGHRVVAVRDSDGDLDNQIFIEVAEPHRIFKMTRTTEDGPIDVTFEYDDLAAIEEPTQAESVSLG